MKNFKEVEWRGYTTLKPLTDVKGFRILVGTPRDFPQSTFKIAHSRTDTNLNLGLVIRDLKVAKSAIKGILFGKFLGGITKENIDNSLKVDIKFWNEYVSYLQKKIRKHDPKTWNAFYD